MACTEVNVCLTLSRTEEELKPPSVLLTKQTVYTWKSKFYFPSVFLLVLVKLRQKKNTARATSAPILRLLIFLLRSNEDKEQMGKNRNFLCLLALRHKTLLR